VGPSRHINGVPNPVHPSVFLTRSVNLCAWFLLYPLWRHAALQSLLWIRPTDTFPSWQAFSPRHNWPTFFLSYTYHFTLWILQINVFNYLRKKVYPPKLQNFIREGDGTYPAALSAVVSDLIPMVCGLGVESILFRRLAREVGPAGLVLGTTEFGNIGLLVKALAAEWAVEWLWLEVQYWTNEAWYKYKEYSE